MTSIIDMSLEEIIKKKKLKSKRKGIVDPNNRIPLHKTPVTDARFKIISKKRTQIADARDKLAELAKQKDARIKLEQIRMRRIGKQQQLPRSFIPFQGKFTRAFPNKERVFSDTSRQVQYQQLSQSKRQQTKTKQFMKNRLIGKQSLDVLPKLKPIVRTVRNDIEIIDEPMEEYSPPKQNPLNRKASLQLRIIAHNDVKDRRTSNAHRTSMVVKEKSPPRPPSILKKRPMAAIRNESKDQIVEKPVVEYRIIVSNLGSTVTGGDIQELFGDVGGMVESRLVRPGTAEVIYKTQEDAQRAVDLYHNRQLDGQPMNCLLVVPRSPGILARNNSKPTLYSTSSNVEPDISTFHKVLFSNL